MHNDELIITREAAGHWSFTFRNATGDTLKGLLENIQGGGTITTQEEQSAVVARMRNLVASLSAAIEIEAETERPTSGRSNVD